MSLRELYSNLNRKPIISYEVFPPKDDADGIKLKKLFDNLKILKKYNPALISLTYGAGGTIQNASLNILEKIQNDLNLSVMPHFTCVCTSRSNVKKYLSSIKALGVKNILALRGDIPEEVDVNTFDFKHANDLVEFIKAETDLHIGVAGYPEGHISCNDFDFDLQNLKRKVDAGADVIYTQMFFDNDKFFNFYQRARDIGIEIPIVPGILPIMSYNQLNKMLSMARVTLPKTLTDRLEKYKNAPDDIKKLGIEFATSQCKQLVDFGIAGLHLYTLNSAFSVSQILDNLSLNSNSKHLSQETF